MFDQKERAVALQGQRQQLARKPEILLPSTFTEVVCLPDLIQVLIERMISISIPGKGGSGNLHLIGNRRQHAGRPPAKSLNGRPGKRSTAS
nr:hypothetical protein [Ktedonobacter racemifer]